MYAGQEWQNDVYGYMTEVGEILACFFTTVMFLSFRTNRPGQTVQTQIRLLLEKQFNLYLHSFLFHPHLLDTWFYGKNRLLHFCHTCFSMGDLGVQVLFVRPSVNIYHGCLVSATPLTVLYRSFWNFADVFFMVWGCACGLGIIVRLFFITFSLCELSHFSTSVYRRWVPCECNSSYNFIPIFLKLCTFFPCSEDVHVVWI